MRASGRVTMLAALRLCAVAPAAQAAPSPTVSASLSGSSVELGRTVRITGSVKRLGSRPTIAVQQLDFKRSGARLYR